MAMRTIRDKLKRRMLWGVPVGVALAILAIPVVVLAAFVASTINGTVQVSEVFEANPTSFETSLYPAENTTIPITVTNLSDDPLSGLVATYIFNSEPEGLVFNGGIPASQWIGGGQSVGFDLLIEAPADIEPNEYSITIDVVRGASP